MNCVKLIPIKKVVELEFSSHDLYNIKYKTWFKECIKAYAFLLAVVAEKMTLKSIVITPRVQKGNKELDKAKKEDLKSMLRFMPSLDQEDYRSLGI